jgi:hypothetical protein
MDVDHIPPGLTSVAHLNSQVGAVSSAVLVPPAECEGRERRATARQSGRLRPIEIAAALARDIRVIPPAGRWGTHAEGSCGFLKPLTRRQVTEVRHAHLATMPRRWQKMREVLGEEALVASGREAVGDKARGRGQWRVGAIAGVAAVAALLLIEWAVTHSFAML